MVSFPPQPDGPVWSAGWRRACVPCAALWVCVIWGHSLQPADVSSAQSGFFTALFAQWLPGLTEHFVRKAAHFAEYAILGGLLASVYFILLGSHRRHLPLVLLLGVTIPLLDETIQLFVPGRNGAVPDVLLDCGGVLAGLSAGSALFLLLLRRLRRRNMERSPCSEQNT